MARHVWSVLCRQAITDQQSNVISLLNAVEEFKFKRTPSLEEIPKKTSIDIPVDLSLVSLFIRSDENKPENPLCRVTIVTPDKQKFVLPEAELGLVEKKRARAIINFQSLVFTVSGQYEYLVQTKKNEKEKSWRKCVSIPLDINQIFD